MALFVLVTREGVPEEGAIVTVLDSNGAVIQISNANDSGRAFIDLAEGLSYFIRASSQDAITTIYEVTGADDGVIEVELLSNTLVPSASARRCRIQGKLIDLFGRPASWPIRISAFEGVARSDEGIVYGNISVSPDEEGEYAFELIKGVSYILYGLPEGGALECTVPDVQALHIKDFIYPKITTLGGLPAAINLDKGVTTSIGLSPLLSNGLEGSTSILHVASSSSHASAHISGNSLLITGITEGSSNVVISQIVDVEVDLYGSLEGNDVHTIAVEVT